MTTQVALLILPVLLTKAMTAFPVVMHLLRLPSCRIHPRLICTRSRRFRRSLLPWTRPS